MKHLENMISLFKQKVIVITFLLFPVFVSISQDFTVATFNCEFLVKSKVHIKYGLPYNIKKASEEQQKKWGNEKFRNVKYEEACNRVAKQILTINSDIIGLSEVGKKEDIDVLMKYINKDKMVYPYWEVSNTKEPTGQHVAILSKYPLKNSSLKITEKAIYFTENDKDESAYTSINKSIVTEITVKDKAFTLFMLHLKSERGGFESDSKRLAQAEIARRKIIQLQSENKYVIVMGDLNSEKRHPTLLRIRGFDDVYEELIQTGDDNYFQSFDYRYTYDYKGHLDQIDHILLSLNFIDLCGNNYPKKNKFPIRTSIIPTNDTLISDHNALKVSLWFK